MKAVLGNELVYFNLSDRTRITIPQISLPSGTLTGLANDRKNLWVIDNSTNMALAYTITGSIGGLRNPIAPLVRDSSQDITLGAGEWQGATCNETTFWVFDALNFILQAWKVSDKTKDTDKTIQFTHLKATTTGLTSSRDGTLWLIDNFRNTARAYEIDPAPAPRKQLYIGTREIKHVYKGTTAIDKIYRGETLVWERGGKPTITNFSITPNSINLNNRPTGNITIAFTATAGSDGSILRAFVTEKSTGNKIGLTYASTNNAPITESFVIPQPSETETYTLIAVGNDGSVHQDAIVTVTEGGPNEISALMANPASIDLDLSSTGNITLSYATKGKRNTLSQGATNIPVLDKLQADTAHDIDLNTAFPNQLWQGATSDYFTIWILQSGANYLRAWNALSKARDSSKDISLGAGTFSAPVYNQGNIWVVIGTEARAYSTNNQQRDSSVGVIAVGAGSWTRAFSDDVTLWFINNTTNRALAWNASSLARDSSKDFGLGSGFWDGSAQSDTAIYLLDRNNVPPVLRAYTKQSRQRRATKDFALPQTGTGNAVLAYRGLVGASGLVFALDDHFKRLYAYKKVEASYLTHKRWEQKDFDLGANTYRGACSDGIIGWIINTATSKAEAWTLPTLRTSAVRMTSRDITLLGGGTFKGLIYSSVSGGRIWVLDNSSLARCYESGPGIRDETRDITHGYSDAERGIANDTYLWIVRGNRNAEAFRISDRTPQSGQLINLPTGNFEGGAINTGPSLYFVNRNASPPSTLTYNATTRARQTSKDFSLGDRQEYRGAVSVGRLAWFINITTMKAEAYYLDADFSEQTIPQPTENTTYRLDSLLEANRYNANTSVEITQNPVLSSLVATGLGGRIGAPGGVTIQITGRVVGYPRPSISISMGWRNPLNDRHFTKVSGAVNTWSFIDTHFFGTSGRRTLTVTATNSSGSVSSDVVFNG